jgi:hypothetical protein
MSVTDSEQTPSGSTTSQRHVPVMERGRVVFLPKSALLRRGVDSMVAPVVALLRRVAYGVLFPNILSKRSSIYHLELAFFILCTLNVVSSHLHRVTESRSCTPSWRSPSWALCSQSCTRCSRSTANTS